MKKLDDFLDGGKNMKKYVNKMGNVVTEEQLKLLIEKEAIQYGITEEQLWKECEYREIEMNE